MLIAIALLNIFFDSIAKMNVWTIKEEAENLRRLFVGVNKAKFARTFKMPGGASMLSQHCSGHRPMSLEAAICYARGFNCNLENISPRLALEIKKASNLSNDDKNSDYVEQFNIKDFSKYTDKLNNAQNEKLEELLSYFVVISEKHQQRILELANDFYETDTKLNSITRLRQMPKGLIEDIDNGTTKISITKLSK